MKIPLWLGQGIPSRFRNVRKATTPWFRKPKRNPWDTGGGSDIRLRLRWHRPSSSWRGWAKAATFFCIAVGVVFASSRLLGDPELRPVFYVIPFCVVGMIAVSASELSGVAKWQWNVAFALIVVMLLV
ncbi:MAG: hypothetical protein ACYTGZ_14090 [Planctomycetota bacterium]|jgi:hypothetical protein